MDVKFQFSIENTRLKTDKTNTDITIFCGMNPSDSEYQIVVDMADNLIPDVCSLIMAFLEAIHIRNGKLRWNEHISKVNAEYRCAQSTDDDTAGYSCLIRGYYDIFSFNYQRLPHNRKIYNKHGSMSNPVARLPANY